MLRDVSQLLDELGDRRAEHRHRSQLVLLTHLLVEVFRLEVHCLRRERVARGQPVAEQLGELIEGAAQALRVVRVFRSLGDEAPPGRPR